MPKGMSLHVGVNNYQQKAYKKLGLPLKSLPNCQRDAEDYQKIARSFNFDTAIFTNKDATISSVLLGIEAAAYCLNYGDMFFLSFSGHGGQIYDRSGDEEDNLDEVWCMFDGIISDDQLFDRWKLFRPGVRVLTIADSCHSGTSIKNHEEGLFPSGPFPLHKADDVQAACLLLAACQDSQAAFSGHNLCNSLYTYWMLKVLKEHRSCESYIDLHNRVTAGMPVSSKPNLYKFGPGADLFARRKPFKI